MRTQTIIATAGLLLSLVSCGNHHSKSNNRAPALDPLVTSADWKILLEGRSFPNKAMITVNDAIVINECANKQSFYINRDSNPQSVTMKNYEVPLTPTVKIQITDLGHSCKDDSDDSIFHDGPQTHYDLNKNGAHAEVLIRL
jgi:hypothetical protein